jgi:ParB family transcriptional regulator, chromosome partitioning protein
MTKSIVPQVRGVATFLNSNERLNQIESAALNSPPQYIDPRLLVRSPYQPRTSFPLDEMDELERSIDAAGGVKVPLIVRPEINEIIAGERRSIIAIKRGDLLVPVFWHTCTDDEAAEFAGFENVKRADLNAIDETNLVINMVKRRLKLSDRQAAIDLIQQISYQQRDKKAESRNNVITSETIVMVEKTIQDFTKGQLSLTSFSANKLRLLNLPTEVVEAIGANRIEYTKAAEIGKIEDEAARRALLDRVVEEGLSFSQVKEEVAKIKPPKAKKSPKQLESLAVDDSIASAADSGKFKEPLDNSTPKVRLEPSQPDSVATESPILPCLGDFENDLLGERIQELTEIVRFKISNETYSVKVKQEIQELLDRVVKILG